MCNLKSTLGLWLQHASDCKIWCACAKAMEHDVPLSGFFGLVMSRWRSYCCSACNHRTNTRLDFFWGVLFGGVVNTGSSSFTVFRFCSLLSATYCSSDMSPARRLWIDLDIGTPVVWKLKCHTSLRRTASIVLPIIWIWYRFLAVTPPTEIPLRM